MAMMTALAQNSADSVKNINREDVVFALIWAKAGVEYKKLSDSLIAQNVIQKKLLEVRQASIKNLSSQITSYRKIIDNDKKVEKQLNDKNKLAQDAISSLNKDLRKQKRTTRWTAIGGLAAVVATIFLLK